MRIGLRAMPFLAVLGGVMFAGSASATLAPGNYTRSMVFDAQTREYDIHVPPSYDGTTPVPLVLDFHGFTATKNSQHIISGFAPLSDTKGFIVVYPQGLFNSWNAGTCCGQAVAQGIDDVGFSRALISAVAAEANIDRRRVYATGLSNGGAMTQRLACEAADAFAAAAPMAYPIPLIPLSSCQPSRPMPVLMFMGLTDQLVSYTTAAPSFDHWRDVDGCGNGSPEQTVVSGASFCETHTVCADGVQAGLCSILSTSPMPFEGHILYANDDFNLAEVAWDFLSQFTLPVTLDHYKCYKIKKQSTPFPATASLQDQFGNESVEIKKAFLWCNPVSTNGSPINDSADHLLCYKIKGGKLTPAPHLQTTNQFGVSTLFVKKPFLLCVPGSKNLIP